MRRLAPTTEGLGLEQVVVRARIPNPATGELRDMVVRISSPVGSGLLITFRPADKLLPLKPLTAYDQKVIRVRQRGLVYPYEIVKMLTPSREDTRAEFLPAILWSTISTPMGGWFQSIVPMVRTRQTSSLELSATSRTDIPRAWRGFCCWEIRAKTWEHLPRSECRLIMAALDLAEE